MSRKEERKTRPKGGFTDWGRSSLVYNFASKLWFRKKLLFSNCTLNDIYIIWCDTHSIYMTSRTHIMYKEFVCFTLFRNHKKLKKTVIENHTRFHDLWENETDIQKIQLNNKFTNGTP